MDKKMKVFAGFIGGLALLAIGAGCGPAAPDITPPAKPTLNAVTTPTNTTPQTISGTKEASTSILLNGAEIVPRDALTTWSYSLTLVEGNNNLIIVAQDKAGNLSQAISPTPIIIYSSTVADTTAPGAPTLSSVTTPTKQATQGIGGTKEANSSVWLNGVQVAPIDANTTWSYTMALMEGDNNLTLSSKDRAGNESVVTSGLIVRDSTPPAAPTLNAVSSPTRVSPESISGTKDVNSSVYLNGAQIVGADSNTSWTYSLTLNAGDNAISLTSRDALGNESPAVTGKVVYDATAPSTPVVNAVTSPTGLSAQTISGTKEANSSILVNGEEQVTLNGSTTWVCNVSLVEGTNTLSVTSKDAAGNTSAAASATIVRDSTAPSAPVLNAVTTPTGLTAQNISGTKEANTSIRLNGAEIVALSASTTWTYSNLALTEGNNNLMLTARDAVGNESPVASGLIVRDTTAPDSPSLNSVVSPTKQPSVTLSGTKEAQTSVFLNGNEIVILDNKTTWIKSGIPLTVGNNSISLTSKDAVGNESGATTGSIVYDNTTPAQPVCSVCGITTNASISILTGTKEANSSIWFGGAERIPINADTSWTTVVMLNNEGANNFQITSRDLATNESTAQSCTITRDTTAPAFSVSTPASIMTLTKNPIQNLSGTGEGASSVWLNGLNIGSVSGGGNWNYSLNLNEGNNEISLQARDTAGNYSGAVTRIIIKDSIPPSTPTLYPSSITTPTQAVWITLAGTKDADSEIWAKIGNGSDSRRVPIDGNTTWNWPTILTVEGQNTYYLTSRDAAGNISSETKVNIYRDRTAPNKPVLNPYPEAITKSPYYTLVGTKDSAEETSIWINGVLRVMSDSKTTWSYVVPLYEGPNSFSITARDAAGNESVPELVSITSDTIPPANPILNALISPTKNSPQTISGTRAAWESTSVWLNGVQIAPLGSAGSVWNFGLNLIEGDNYISLSSKDAAGNESGVVFGQIVLDTTPPMAPVLMYYESPTNKTPQMLIGIKEAGSSVMINGKVKVTYSEATTWVYRMPLAEGPNAITMTSWDVAKNESSLAGPYSITLDTSAPTAPYVKPVDTITNEPLQLLSGYKAANSSVWLNGSEVVPVNASTTWSYGLLLFEGHNWIGTIDSYDEAGNGISGFGVPQDILLDTVPPEAPRLIYPLNHHMTRDGGSYFQWAPVYYPNGSTAYNFQVAMIDNNVPDFNVPFVDATVYEPWFGWGGMGNNNFSWRVRARDAAGNWGPYSSPTRDIWLGRAAGDINENNYDNIIVGAPTYNYTPPGPITFHPGRAYVYDSNMITMTMCTIENPNTVYSGDWDYFGNAVAMLGDLDGDDQVEMAVGSPYATQKLNWSYYPQAGSAFIVKYDSKLMKCYISQQLMAPPPIQSSENFGSSIAGAGDINGDGYMDLIVGAPGWDDGAQNDKGRVLIYLGGSHMNYLPDKIIKGENGGDMFGYSVAGIGDFNDDGYDDFIVGAHNYRDVGQNIYGRAYIFYGGPDHNKIGFLSPPAGYGYKVLQLPPAFRNLSANNNDDFGYSVSGGGDYNDDGYTDAIIGAPYADPVKMADSGMVMVVYGPDAHTWTVLDERFLGTYMDSGDNFGTSVGSVMGENKIGNILVGSPWGDWHLPSDGISEGYMGLFEGTSSGVDKHGSVVGKGINNNDGYGYSVSTAGDINTDGTEDYLAGSYGYPGRLYCGMIEVIYSNHSMSSQMVNPMGCSVDEFGFSVGGGGGAGK